MYRGEEPGRLIFLTERAQPPHADPLLIAGGGVGGLTAALLLAQAGFHIHILEQAETLSEIGAGLQLSPNATRILAQLGILDRLAGKLGEPDALRIYSAMNANQLAEMPLGLAAQERWGAPYYVAHRADLQKALHDACIVHANITMHFDCAVTRYDASDGITLFYQQNGVERSQRGCVLIGADGLHSKIRAQFLNDGPARKSGYTAYRATFHADALPSPLSRTATSLWLGPDLHVVHYPLRDGLINIVAVLRETMAGEGWGVEASPDSLFAMAKTCAPLFKSVLQTPQSWTRWPLFDRAADKGDWPHAPVTLLGDAAHPMLPFLAQGAAQAIEDADVLTGCLTEEPQYPADAFAAYRTRRAGRVARIQRMAKENGRIFHYSGLRVFARDGVLRLMSGKRLMPLYDWVYGDNSVA